MLIVKILTSVYYIDLCAITVWPPLESVYEHIFRWSQGHYSEMKQKITLKNFKFVRIAVRSVALSELILWILFVWSDTCLCHYIINILPKSSTSRLRRFFEQQFLKILGMFCPKTLYKDGELVILAVYKFRGRIRRLDVSDCDRLKCIFRFPGNEVYKGWVFPTTEFTDLDPWLFERNDRLHI